jgi:hypothetical protein
MDDFIIWKKEYNEGYCVIGDPVGFEDEFLLMEGVELLKQWPDNVVCKMSARYPKDIQLADNLYGGSYAVISQRLKEKVAALGGASPLEFLPVTILNHKGRSASKDYFILNPVGSVDCIDIKKSGVEWNSIDEDDISDVEQLVLKKGAVPAKVVVFRPKHLASTILVRRALADQLSSDGLTGLYFEELEDFSG